MLISDSIRSTYLSGPADKAALPAPNDSSASFADYSDPKNALFQNLLERRDVRDNVVAHDDGTYSFVGSGILSERALLARQLIQEQNGYEPAPGDFTRFSVGELQQYRELTGYNLIQAAGSYTVVDDHGNAPADIELAEAAWKLFDHAKHMKEIVNPGGELTIDDLMQAATELSDRAKLDHTNWAVFDALLDRLRDSRADAAAAQNASSDEGAEAVQIT